jgi:hypothetical protein
VLPAIHKRLITSEINTILREINDNQSWVEKERHSSSMNRNASSSSAMDTSGSSSKQPDFLKRNHSLNSRSPPPEPLAGSFSTTSEASLARRDSSVEEFLDFPVKGTRLIRLTSCRIYRQLLDRRARHGYCNCDE